MMSCSAFRRGVNSEVSVVERASFIERESVLVSAQRLVVRDTVYRDVAVALRDTLREVTTVTVQIGATGDTVMRSVVTDRFRGRGTGLSHGIVESRNYETLALARGQSLAVDTRNDVVVEHVNEGTLEKTGGIMGWTDGLVVVMKWIVGVAVMVVIGRIAVWLLVRFR